MHTYIVVVIVCVTKIVTTYAQVNLTETRGSVHSRMFSRYTSFDVQLERGQRVLFTFLCYPCTTC